ncbi:PEP-CTERM sorting domain-containing protein [Coleofasciculus sp. FACHB-64]|nr:PEP-CTERM sorting domain-containing protein [Coleofasciculus sp. FACHB-501]MBD1903738.1 PEP-CTERM sorting domain-containing protein [Coleofasciculus sp. FACHB-125]MBD2046499.1 PEP-CTERM sorting domain-containing protein [Coleofasciculus sp. FACHB-64]
MHYMAISIILKKLFIATSGAALLVLSLGGTVQAKTFTFNTSDSPFTPGVDNQGWWNKIPVIGNTNTTNDNYYVGKNPQYGEVRNFFTFDLSSLLATETVISARLELKRNSSAGDATETFGLFDVSTDAATLNNNTGMNAEIFDDLGTGKSYGAFEVTTDGDFNEILSFTLNSAAIADISASKGSFFSIGGALLSLNNSEFHEFLFGDSQDAGEQRLIIETAPKTTSVPEPASVLGLLSVAAFGAGSAVKHKQQQKV